MKFKLLASVAMVLGLVSVAHADQKVAEYGDPLIGNSYGGCTFSLIYQTGGSGFLYNQYQISCPSGTYIVGVYQQTSSSPYGQPVCTFTTGSSSYYAEGSCSNWRVYLRP